MRVGSGDDGEADPIPISLVAHHVFCPRRAWIEAAGERTDTYQMAVGVEAHEATDEATSGRPARLRAVDVGDPELGISGRCDTIEVGTTGALPLTDDAAFIL